MKLLGKLDGSPVYEFDRGQYVIINPNRGKWMATWLWSGYLGKYYDTFMKCSDCEEDEKCLNIIDDNKESILVQLERVYKNAEDNEEELEEQDRFYDALKEGETYSWYSEE